MNGVAMDSKQRQTILLVDDRPQDLLLLINHFDHAGYDVVVANSGQVALERLQTRTPDLVLLDVVMPEMDGYETCHVLKSKPEMAEVPVLFLTSLSEPVDKIRGFQVGGVDYITKPIEPNEMLARVQTHITLRQLRQQVKVQNDQLQVQNGEQAQLINEYDAKLKAEIHLRQQTQIENHAIHRLMQEQDSQLIEVVMKVFGRKTDAPNLFQILCTPIQLQVTQSEMILDQILSTKEGALCDNPAETKLTVPLAKLQAIHAHIVAIRTHIEQFVSHEAVTEYGETAAKIDALSEREHEVFVQLVNGASISAIAKQLNISGVTVRTHRTRIMNKLDVPHVTALVKIALQQGIIRP